MKLSLSLFGFFFFVWVVMVGLQSTRWGSVHVTPLTSTHPPSGGLINRS